MYIVEAVIFSQVNQHPCGTATFSGTTEAAVTDPSARRALPLLPMRLKLVTLIQHIHKTMLIQSPRSSTHRIQQSVLDLLSIAVTETGATELTPHPHTLWITTVCFCVSCFLAALVASGSLRERKKVLLSAATELYNKNAAAQIFSALQ